MKQGCFIRAPREGFTACPEKRYGSALAVRHDEFPPQVDFFSRVLKKDWARDVENLISMSPDQSSLKVEASYFMVSVFFFSMEHFNCFNLSSIKGTPMIIAEY